MESNTLLKDDFKILTTKRNIVANGISIFIFKKKPHPIYKKQFIIFF